MLDIPFSTEEDSAALGRLKNRKAAGPDGLMAEHLKLGGDLAYENSECCVRAGGGPWCAEKRCGCTSIQGGGKDPLKTNSYREITLHDIDGGKSLGVLCVEETTNGTN